MGASGRAWGGRWTAVNSLWTYVHRLLHVIGISAVDKEELALLSAPLVRLRSPRQNLVLAHHLDPLYPDEPLGWLNPSIPQFHSTLFFLHLDSSDNGHPDRARLATAQPPRAWLTVDHKTGFITLTVSEFAAAVFDVKIAAANSAKVAEVTLACSCAVAKYFSARTDSMRARICANSVGSSELFVINHIPLAPTLEDEGEPPVDCTMMEAYKAPRFSPVRIQSRALGWFLASKPGADVGGATGRDVGWDGFVLEFDSATRSARLRDSRGWYLTFSPQMDAIVAAAAEEPNAVMGERFVLKTVGGDDRVVLKSRKGYLSARRGGKIVLSKDTLPGKREHFYLRLALPSMMDESQPRLRLRVSAEGARQIEASVLVPTNAAVAYEVLCDYDGFCKFIGDVSDSKVLERRSGTELTVLMVQSHSFLMLTIPMTMELSVVEKPEDCIVTLDLVKGWGVRQYKGVWQAVERSEGRCQIQCTLLASTTVPAPGFLIDGLMSHAMRSTMEQLRTECVRRSTAE